VFEHEFRTRVLHLPFSRSSPSRFQGQRLTLYTASQAVLRAHQSARLLGWPESRVRVKVAFLGGG
jgi:hypothetical protein